MNFWIIILIMILTGMLLLGDYFIKYSTTSPHSIRYLLFAIASWVASIPGWFYIVKDHRIAIVGMLFAVFSLVGTTLIGVFCFNEKLTIYEYLGLTLAIISSILLSNKI